MLLIAVLGTGLASAPNRVARAQESATVTTLYTFSGGKDGSQPQSLLIAGDGSFYGTAAAGGANGYGTIFRLAPTGELTTVYSFTGGTDGAYPVPGLVQDGAGNLYGVASSGGTAHGTIFKLTTSGTLTVLHTFSGNETVGNPFTSLVLGTDGNFYGTANSAYRITPTGDFTQFRANYDLDDGLILGHDGNFYGAGKMASNGTPVVVQVTPAGAVTTVASNIILNQIPLPAVSLTQGGDGNIYGAADGQGIRGDGGTVFRLALDGTYTRLGGFYNPQDGSYTSNSALVEGRDGNFYGATISSAVNGNGTLYDAGTIYEVTPAGKFTYLYTFPTSIAPDGYFRPRMSLVFGPDGNLYGTTTLGGAQNSGGIIKVTLHPAFFTGAAALDNGVYYLAFASGNYFGYYSFLTDPNYLYHFDLGYEYVFNSDDGNSGVYLYDFSSGTFFYTSPTFPFPYLYDFSLNSVVYYYPDPNRGNPGHYNTNGLRYFYVFSTGKIISK